MVVIDPPKILPKTVVDYILNQIKNCIARIESKKVIGFFCKIPFPDNNNLIPVFIYPHESINQYNNKNISFCNENYKFDYKILSDNSRKFFTYKNFDIIEIKQEDNFNINEFLEIDESLYNNNPNVIRTETYSLDLTENKKKCFSLGLMKEQNEKIFEVDYYVRLGGPILNINNKKIIGIGKPISEDKKNTAIPIKGLIEEFNKYFKKDQNLIPYLIVKFHKSINPLPIFGLFSPIFQNIK